ncbi:MAG: hypothetical protein KIT16_07220 [Rhodospirillaceae bacterium]|nr:hypothetical protein [Rhodospirillaceae bacterium]
MRPIVILLMAALPLAACAGTDKPKGPDPAEVAFEKGTAESRVCFEKVTEEKRFAGVKAKFVGVSGGEPTKRQLADRRKPSAAEAKSVTAYHTAIGPCRNTLYTAAAGKPRFAKLLKLYHTKNDAVFKAVSARKLTWGKANGLIKENAADFAKERQKALADRDGDGKVDDKAGEPKCVVTPGDVVRCTN